MTLGTADFWTAPLSALSGVDITDARFKANPFPFYARLREEAPVFPVTLRRLRCEERAWLVTRYGDVLAVLRDDATFVKDPHKAMTPAQLRRVPSVPAVFGPLGRNLLSLDGADHDRLKVLVHRAFTPRMVERMRDQTQAVTDEALDRALRRSGMDLIADFALPVPLRVIGRILGVPGRDHGRFSAWTRAFVSVGHRSPLTVIPSVLAFIRYLRGLIRERRARPRNDLTSALVAAQEGSDTLTDDEVLAMIFLLLSAGHETTVNLIGSGTLALLGHPDQMERLRDDPALMGSGVEELARFVVPAETATERYAARDVEVAGTLIPRGELVVAVLASANRDPAQFERPDTLDLGRANNRHLSFGQGMHYCLGAPLSRMEAQVALTTLLRRAPNLRLRVPEGQLRWRSGFILRGLEALPVTL
ncbi:polyketide biosynthesis cytochrome P450 PksS (plasmid) [Deinococcus aetherius]|uniref:Polyketide biosynthesis cytochrome P450 PksS n=1 Tax=Deinococcus aetherius TaxID=200252 RepID=A0ABN6RM57_9DEIO|nr:cytochrome P450 [Deinococcus aetherius]BDP43954.1 polyketide biosynthesis cytochrome P450 PksS [Deinococcus aetherius]